MSFAFILRDRMASQRTLTTVRTTILQSLQLSVPYNLLDTLPTDKEQNDFFITGSEDGMVCMYSLETYLYDKLLTRYTLPIRDIALSPDGKWAAIASE